MIVWASALEMGVGRFWRPLRGVGVLAMPDAELDTTRHVESVCVILLVAGVLGLVVPSVEVGVIIDRRCVVDGMEVRRWVISVTRELFSEDEGGEFWPWIVEATELPPWEEFLSPASYRNASLSRGKLRIPCRPTGLLILTISKTSNISYDRRRDRVRAMGRHHLIWMFDVKTEGIFSSACICNRRRGTLLFERLWRDSTNKGGAVLTALDTNPW